MTNVAHTNTPTLAPIARCAGCQLAIDPEPDPDQIDRDLLRSDELLDELAAGIRFSHHPRLGRGLERLREERAHGVLRRLSGCCTGLPRAFPQDFYEVVPRDCRRIALADYEVLEWRVYTLQYLERSWLPVLGKDVLYGSLAAHDLRAWLGRSQSFINKYAALYPRVHDEDFGQGIPLEVPTKDFFRYLNSPNQRCMRSHACMQHLRIG